MIFSDEVQHYATSLIGFFIRKGKKTLAESLIHNFIANKMTSKNKNIYSLLARCKIKTSTYLGLLAKRRGKRVKYRIKFLNKEVGEKRGLVLVGRSVYQATKKSSRQFNTLLNQELETWSMGKHSWKDKYKETHIIARKHAPRGWFRVKKRKF